MRLDHFVLYNNQTTKKEASMPKTKIDRYLLAALNCTHIIPQTTQKEASMPKNNFPQNCPSITLNRVFHDGLMVWVRQQQKSTSNLIYGRIQDTGINYIVEGYNVHNDWVRIPCSNLPSAQLLLGKVMDRDVFHVTKVWEMSHK